MIVNTSTLILQVLGGSSLLLEPKTVSQCGFWVGLGVGEELGPANLVQVKSCPKM